MQKKKVTRRKKKISPYLTPGPIKTHETANYKKAVIFESGLYGTKNSSDLDIPNIYLEVEKTGGTKNDDGKLRLELIPVSAITSLGKALSFGAKKYDDRNWEKGFKFGRVFGALLRHLYAWYGGEDIDPESGLNHLELALCNVTFLNELRTTHPELDDRVKHE